MDMERRFRQLQRATVARSALDVIALIFLFAGFAFWGVAFWQLLAPPQLVSLLSIQAAVLALVYSLAAPLLLSMLVPTTPAGQLLQKTQWRTIGFPVIVGCALFLSYQAEYMLELWLTAQTAVQEAGFARPMAISLMIAFVVVPALAWVQLTPERWLAQIQQAHQVKKLEMQQRGELAIIKASILSAERKALLGWANLLPLEQQEVLSTIRGLIMASSDAQRDIVRTLGLGAELERDILGDDQIAAQMDYVAQKINVLPDLRPIDAPAETGDTRALARQDAHPAHVNTRLQSSQSRAVPSDNGSQRPIVSDSVARKIAAELPRIFTAQNLADLVQQDKRTAQRTIATWLDEGMIEQVQLGRYTLIAESGT